MEEYSQVYTRLVISLVSSVLASDQFKLLSGKSRLLLNDPPLETSLSHD